MHYITQGVPIVFPFFLLCINWQPSLEMDGLRGMDVAESRLGWKVGILSSSAWHTEAYMVHKFGAGSPLRLSTNEFASARILRGSFTSFPEQLILSGASRVDFVGPILDNRGKMTRSTELSHDSSGIPGDAYADSYQCCSCRRLTPYTCDICDDAVCEVCIADDDGSLVCPWCARHIHAHDDACFSFGADVS